MELKDYESSKQQFYVQEGIIVGGKMYETVIEYTEPEKSDNGTIDYVTKTISRYADTEEEAKELKPYLEKEVERTIAKKRAEIIRRVSHEQAKRKFPDERREFGYYSSELKKYQEQIAQELEKSIHCGINSTDTRRITDLVIDTKETMIGKDAFKGQGLKSVTFGPNVTVVSRGSFEDNELEKVFFSQDLGVIGEGAFANNKLRSVYIPKRVTSINASAFANNELENVSFDPNSELTYIGSKAFANNKLGNVILPQELTRLYADSFDENVQHNNVRGSIVLSERRR